MFSKSFLLGGAIYLLLAIFYCLRQLKLLIESARIVLTSSVFPSPTAEEGFPSFLRHLAATATFSCGNATVRIPTLRMRMDSERSGFEMWGKDFVFKEEPQLAKKCGLSLLLVLTSQRIRRRI
jgi:hypothetical protein